MKNTKCSVATCRVLSVTALVLISILGLTSCIQQNPPLDFECDIISAVLISEEGDYPLLGLPNIDNDSITFTVKEMPNTNTKLALKDVVLSSGATIYPNPSEWQDFSDPVIYTINAKDGDWSKNYTVRLTEVGIPSNFSFEDYSRNDFDVFYENYRGQKLDIWASGNAGYKITGQAGNPAQYPTTVAVGDGYNSTSGNSGVGTAVKLVTHKIEGIAALFAPLAAGSLYLGTFQLASPTKPRSATKFGVPFNKKPTSITGFYRYKVGTGGSVGEGVTTDEPSIFAVLYEPTPEKPFLDGDNILTSPQIVAVAQVIAPTEGWTTTGTDYAPFLADFKYDYLPDGKAITILFDSEKAKAFEYNIAIVFSSSKDGAYFKGIVGSELYIDEVTLNSKDPL